MKPLVVRKSVDEWAVYHPQKPGEYLGSVLRFSRTQFSAYPGGIPAARGSSLDQWFTSRQAAANAITFAYCGNV